MRFVINRLFKRPAKKIQRGRPAPRDRRPTAHMRRLRRAGAALSVLACLGGGLVAGWQGGAFATVAGQFNSWSRMVIAQAGLEVHDILVAGRGRTSRGDLMRAIATPRGSSIFDLDLAEIQRRVETLPWVKTAVVRRQLPATLYVDLTERRPLALWQHQAKLRLVDRDGEVIAVQNLTAFAELPILVGADAPARGQAALEMIATSPALAARVRALTWVGARRWTVRLDNDVDILLPETDPGRAWRHLANLQRDHDVLARHIVTIDMRIPEQLVMRLAPAAFEQISARGKET
ncbi:MAG: cell division protein FtsQ/DivIB [Pseudomonadota bacterium]|nr:cell division protein FtsQ/DivIB [Pseudomonadota bacterium]MEC9215911.1 cell division protein FtsQ/DivIB [Pseudomonadota bacterium]